MDARRLPTGRSIVEVNYSDPGRETDYIEGVHQILMISDEHISLTHGAEIATLPYSAIKEIIVRFKQ